MGVVYYANYFVWFEVGRCEWLSVLGWTYRAMEESGVLRCRSSRRTCQYQQPAHYDDEIEVSTTGSLFSPVRVEFRYEIAPAAAIQWSPTLAAPCMRRSMPTGDRAGCPIVIRSVSHESARDGRGRFIGSHLANACWSGASLSSAWTASPTTIARAMKERNLARHGHARDSSLSRRQPCRRRFRRLLDGVTHVFHLAAQAGVRKSWGRDFRDLYGAKCRRDPGAARSLRRTPLERLVYASSSSVYGDHVALPMREDAVPQPLSPYGVTKLAAEHLCQLYFENYGLPAVSLRYFTVYGPRQRPDMAFHRFIRATLEGEPITLFGDGEQTRDFTFVADAVGATIAAGERGVPGRVYNIGGGSRVTVNQVIEVLERVCGRPLLVDRQPDQKGDMRHTYADTTLARRDLGFSPSVTLEQGLQAEHRWLTSISTASA